MKRKSTRKLSRPNRKRPTKAGAASEPISAEAPPPKLMGVAVTVGWPIVNGKPMIVRTGTGRITDYSKFKELRPPYRPPGYFDVDKLK